MPPTPFPWTDFSGLDLRSEADEAGAIDLKNVLFDKPGAIRSRYGSKLFATPSSATTVPRMRPFYRTAGDQLLVHFTTASAGKVTAFNSVGTAVATQTMNSSASVCDFASLGTPAAQRAYVCDSGGLMYRWDGAAFTQVAGSPKCSYVAAWDDYLVAANISTIPTGSGATASSSLVHFSVAGSPETWNANDYDYLAAGDGDAITAVATWQNLLFVFKRFKFYVFYGVTEDSSGNPEFLKREIATGHASPQTPFSAVAAPEGVYFVGADGVYLTTGFAPRKVSSPIDPFFTGDTNAYWTGSTVGQDLWGDGTDATNVWGDGTNAALRWGDGASGDMRVAYAANQLAVFRRGQTDMFVLDTQTNEWTYWVVPLANYSMTSFQYGGAGPEVFLLGQTTKVLRMDKSATTDDGTAITAHYRSGFFDLNYIRRQRKWIPVTDQEATIRESILDGTGNVYLSVARDWAIDSPTTGGGARTQVTLGTAPATGQGRHRKAQRGRAMSFKLETVSGAWRVEDIVFHLTGFRQPGVQTT